MSAPAYPRLRAVLAVLFGALVLLIVPVIAPVSGTGNERALSTAVGPSTAHAANRGTINSYANQQRAAAGASALKANTQMTSVAQNAAARSANSGALVSDNLSNSITSGWTSTKTVKRMLSGNDPAAVYQATLPAHSATMNGSWSDIGTGYATVGGKTFVILIYATYPPPAPKVADAAPAPAQKAQTTKETTRAPASAIPAPVAPAAPAAPAAPVAPVAPVAPKLEPAPATPAQTSKPDPVTATPPTVKETPKATKPKKAEPAQSPPAKASPVPTPTPEPTKELEPSPEPVVIEKVIIETVRATEAEQQSWSQAGFTASLPLAMLTGTSWFMWWRNRPVEDLKVISAPMVTAAETS